LECSKVLTHTTLRGEGRRQRRVRYPLRLTPVLGVLTGRRYSEYSRRTRSTHRRYSEYSQAGSTRSTHAVLGVPQAVLGVLTGRQYCEHARVPAGSEGNGRRRIASPRKRSLGFGFIVGGIAVTLLFRVVAVVSPLQPSRASLYALSRRWERCVLTIGVLRVLTVGTHTVPPCS
jgi:hypothetical protein